MKSLCYTCIQGYTDHKFAGTMLCYLILKKEKLTHKLKIFSLKIIRGSRIELVNLKLKKQDVQYVVSINHAMYQECLESCTLAYFKSSLAWDLH